jgi:plastocyanin
MARIVYLWKKRSKKLKWAKLIAISIGISATAMTVLSSSSLSLIPFPKTGSSSAFAIETGSNSSNSNSNRTIGNVTAETIKKTSSATSNAFLDSKLVTFVSNIEKIKGHTEQAILNKKTGNDSLAEAHTLHPIAEIFSDITVQLAYTNSSLNQTLSSSLNKLLRTVSNSTAEQFAIEANHTNQVLDQTINEVVPFSDRNNSKLNLKVVANLLNTAKKEYREAIENGKLSLIVEYQDAKGFISRAETIFTKTSGKINKDFSAQVQQINILFSDLDKAIERKSDVKKIETTIDDILHEMAEITGLTENDLLVSHGKASPPTPPASASATEESKKKSLQTVANVRILLNQTFAKYREQKYSEAESLAIKAYLENYENIEGDLAKFDQPLEKTIEVMLREHLRHAIQQKQPVEKIEQIIGNINNNLVKAENLLSTSKPELGLGSMNIPYAPPTAATIGLSNQTLSTNSSLKMTNHTNTNTNTTSSSAGYEKNKVSITDEESDKPFNPSPLMVKIGDTVIWRNDDIEIHTVTSSGNSSSSLAMTGKNKELDSGPLNPRQTFEHTFQKPGKYIYFMYDSSFNDRRGCRR